METIIHIMMNNYGKTNEIVISDNDIHKNIDFNEHDKDNGQIHVIRILNPSYQNRTMCFPWVH